MKTDIKNKDYLIEKLLEDFSYNNLLSSYLYYKKFLEEIKNVLKKNKNGLYINENEYNIFYELLPQYMYEISSFNEAIKFLKEYDPYFTEILSISKELNIKYEDLNIKMLINFLLKKLIIKEAINIFKKYFKK